MVKEFVPYELAVKLKEIGFNEPCMGVYFGNGEIEITLRMVESGHIPCPTFSQAFRWFREKYKLHNGIYPYYDEYEFQIKDFRLPINTPINGGLMPYEEAELACLIKLIEIVEQK